MYQIGDKLIGQNKDVYVIAEVGVNHNGDVELAKSSIDAAKNAGADAVKFQTWITEKLVAPDARQAAYQTVNTGREQTQFQLLKSLELTQKNFRDLKQYAADTGIEFLSTPDEEESADFLSDLGVSAFKIGSGEVTNIPFLKHLARKEKPLILSTGMSTLGEVEDAINAIENEGNTSIILLHCVSEYPANPMECNLRAIDTLKHSFKYPVGFSDHTLGMDITIAAVAVGACVVEKHLTINKKLDGPDHSLSLNPDEFKVMVDKIRLIESALGNGRKIPSESEAKNKEVVQKSLVSSRAIRAGSIIEMADVVLLRASGGLPPNYMDIVVGKRLKRDMKCHETFDLNIIE